MILNQTALVLIGLLVAAWTLAAGWAILSARINHDLSGMTGTHGGGFASLRGLPAELAAQVERPLAHAFAYSFRWAIVLLMIAFVPALVTAIRKPVNAPSSETRA